MTTYGVSLIKERAVLITTLRGFIMSSSSKDVQSLKTALEGEGLKFESESK